MSKKIVILGGQGFVGSRLVRKLKEKKHDILSIDQSSTPSIDNQIQYLKMDLLTISIDELSRIFENSIVIYLSAVSTSDECEKRPEQALDINIKLTQKIIVASNKVDTRVIFASSEWVYQERKKFQQNLEDEILLLNENTNLYTMTKIVGEWMFLKYSNQYQILRFGIIYGERDNIQSAVESIVNKAVEGEVIEIGSLETSRRFIHVEDVCDAIIKAIDGNFQNKSIYNLAGLELVSLKDVANIAEKILGKEVFTVNLNKKTSIRNPVSDKFYTNFNWQPKIAITKGVENLINFYLEKKKEVK